MAMENFILYIIVFLYGTILGSFLNVCIYRLPKKENIVTVGSHCMNCSHKLKWYDLFPLFSWIFLRGRCRYCKAPVSKQYPIVEFLNGVLYCLVFAVCGWNWDSVLWCLMISALLVIALIDYRTLQIPGQADAFIVIVGVIHLLLHLQQWLYYVIGFVATGAFLLLIAIVFKKVTGKSGLGYGDIELMACSGLCVGPVHSLLALVVASVLASFVEGVRIIITKKNDKFALGPYLAIGITVALLFGDSVFRFYFRML